MGKRYIGIDIGTSSVKMGLFNQSCDLLQSFRKKYSYSSLANGVKEIDPLIWWQIIKSGLKTLFVSNNEYKNSSDSPIVTIAITGQMHTSIFLDKNGESIRPAIMWNDTRTKSLISHLRDELLNIKNQENAKIISTGSPLANLMWLKQYEPTNFEKLSHFQMPVDYIVYKLTGKYTTDFCDSSTSSMFDFEKNNWSHEILKKFQIRASILPPIVYSSKKVGPIQKDVAKELSLPGNIEIIEGTGDNAATALANRINFEQTPLISLGTSGVVIIPNSQHELKKVGKNIVFRITNRRATVLTQGTVQAGASLNAWWLKNIIHSNKVNELQSKIPNNLLGHNSVLFFPHVNGEKTLFANPNLKGAFVGIDLNTNRENLYLAILEGVTFGCKQLFDQMKNAGATKYIRLVGGGAKSNLWLKIFANVFDLPVKKSQQPHEAMEGAIALALISDDENVNISTRDVVFKPDQKLVSLYKIQYRRYLKLVSIMKEKVF